ncbi:MAG: sulfatase-like hydrolase/transferase [Pseudomonadota bacterium]
MRTLLFVTFLLFGQAAHAATNILLVIADDMGVDASPCHAEGSDLVRMPNLTQLCRTGMVFNNAYAAPTCSPTRATIMTGRYGFRTGIGGAIRPTNTVTLADTEISLFDVLNETTDYASAIIGKWHLSSNATDYAHPSRLGVTHFFGIFSGGIKDYYDWTAVEADTTGNRNVQIDTYATTEISNRAIDWIAGQSTPWFLWLAYNAPHAPFHVPPADPHAFGNLTTDTQAIRRNPQAHYFAALEALDRELGRVLASMDTDTRANTVVVFMGDNGTPGQIRRSSGNADRAKGSIYDGGTRVPVVFSGPGVKAGRTDALMNSTDLYATILALAGASSAAEDSIDQNPVLRGAAQGPRKYAYIEHFSDGEIRGKGSLGWAVRDARYKLVRRKGHPEELYDLSEDVDERRDLLSGSATTTGIAKRLRNVRDGLTQ